MIKECDETAYDILIKKYTNLISKKIREFNIVNYYDDIFQESLLVLIKCVDSYIDSESRFNSYFQKALINRLCTLSERYQNYNKSIDVIDYIGELRDNTFINHQSLISNEEAYKILDKDEAEIIKLKYEDNLEIKDIAIRLSIKPMKVYYILRKAKEKIIKKYE